MRRVVVTGMGAITALGNSWPEISSALKDGQSGIEYREDFKEFVGLRTRLSGKKVEFEVPDIFDRKQLRSMSRGALMAVVAANNALNEAKIEVPLESSERCGVAFGTCLSASEDLMNIATACGRRNLSTLLASSYLKVMSHSSAASLSIAFNLKGRLIPTNSACASSSQAIGYGYESIKYGQQDLMLVGGSEELCVGLAAMFDSMSAAIDGDQQQAELQPRPFDSKRSGLVVAEGACCLILEELGHAQRRGANILAEVISFSTNCNAGHMTQPDVDTMQAVMIESLEQANLQPHELGFVSLHGTATEIGDISEGKATFNVLGSKVPATALKSYFGHTLGAAGALESFISINSLHDKCVVPTKNLDQIDVRLAQLDFVREAPRKVTGDYVMVNNFAFGGVNTSLIFGLGKF